jgi:hypothetical protein
VGGAGHGGLVGEGQELVGEVGRVEVVDCADRVLVVQRGVYFV